MKMAMPMDNRTFCQSDIITLNMAPTFFLFAQMVSGRLLSLIVMKKAIWQFAGGKNRNGGRQ